ncbi:unnamed protein product, partial [Mycena citricolor]
KLFLDGFSLKCCSMRETRAAFVPFSLRRRSNARSINSSLFFPASDPKNGASGARSCRRFTISSSFSFCRLSFSSSARSLACLSSSASLANRFPSADVKHRASTLSFRFLLGSLHHVAMKSLNLTLEALYPAKQHRVMIESRWMDSGRIRGSVSDSLLPSDSSQGGCTAGLRSSSGSKARSGRDVESCRSDDCEHSRLYSGKSGKSGISGAAVENGMLVA